MGAGLTELLQDLSAVQALKRQISSRRDALDLEVDALSREEILLANVSDALRVLIDREVVDAAHIAESLLSEGLAAIFDDIDLSVRVAVETQRGKVSINFTTIQKVAGTVVEGDATASYGGSVATIQSMLLRIVVSSRRGLAPVLILDESLGAVAEQYVPRAAQFLSMLCKRLGMGVLVVTHNPALVEEADTGYRIQRRGTEARFHKLPRSKGVM